MRESIYIIKTQLLCVCLTHPLSWYFLWLRILPVSKWILSPHIFVISQKILFPRTIFPLDKQELLFSISEDPLTGVRHYNPTNGNCPGIGSPMTSVYLSKIDLTTSLFIFAYDLRSIERSECQKIPAYESN